MGIDEFKNKIEVYIKNNNIDIDLNEEVIIELYKYMKFILEKNKYINLTAIKNEEEFIEKHIIDSLYIDKYIKKIIKDLTNKKDNKVDNKKLNLLDIGTGGGFPLVPIYYVNQEELDVYGLDSTLKKLKVIQEGTNNEVNIIHGRAEILAHNKKYREQFDIILTRAVALLDNVLEYMCGYTKIGGYLICMKGNEEEFDKNKLKKFGIELIKKEKYFISGANRTLYIFKKISNTNVKVPNKNAKYYKKRKDNL